MNKRLIVLDSLESPTEFSTFVTVALSINPQIQASLFISTNWFRNSSRYPRRPREGVTAMVDGYEADMSRDGVAEPPQDVQSSSKGPRGW